MDALNEHISPSKKLQKLVEYSRTGILEIGYRVVEIRSRFKKKVKDSYQQTQKSSLYENITLGAVERQRGKRFF